MAIKHRHLKKGFVLGILLAISFVIVTMCFTLDLGYLEKSSNTSVKYSESFSESGSESQMSQNSSDLKLKGELSQFKATNLSAKKHSTVSRCGYDVSK